MLKSDTLLGRLGRFLALHRDGHGGSGRGIDTDRRRGIDAARSLAIGILIREVNSGMSRGRCLSSHIDRRLRVGHYYCRFDDTGFRALDIDWDTRTFALAVAILRAVILVLTVDIALAAVALANTLTMGNAAILQLESEALLQLAIQSAAAGVLRQVPELARTTQKPLHGRDADIVERQVCAQAPVFGQQVAHGRRSW